MSLNSSTRKFGSLQCRVIDALPDEAALRCLVVLNHGYGAPGDDLVDFGPMLCEASAAISESCRFVFPAAPIDLSPVGMPGSRAWWPINMARLAAMHETHDFDQLTRLEPPAMSEAGDLLIASLREMQSEWGLSDSQIVLGGFSQGAMVSTHVTLSGPVVPALLVVCSGSLLWSDHWKRLAEIHPGTSVLQSHGRQDQILPFSTGVQLRDLLSEAGFSVEFVPFDGPHTIPFNVLQRLQTRIENCLSIDNAN